MSNRMLLTNAHFFVDSKLDRVESILVVGGRITELYHEKMILPNDVQVVDLNGAFVYPGFIDTHTHSFEGGLYTGGVNLLHCTSISDVLDTIRTRASDNSGEVLFCWAFDENNLVEKRFPFLHELDIVSSRTPIILRRIDGHSCIINSALAKKLSLDPSVIYRGSENDHIVHQLHSNLSDEAILRAYEVASHEALKGGFTTIHSMVGDAENSLTHYSLIDHHKSDYSVDYVLYPQSFNIEAALDAGSERIGGCILADGSFGSYTAAISSNYIDKGTKGVLYHTNEYWDAFIRRAHASDLQVAVHCIGDLAIRQINDIFSRVQQESPKDLRHELIHMELTPDDLIEQIAKSGAHAVMQPAFDMYWGGGNGFYESVLGKERSLIMNRFASLISNGINLCFGSDWYITELDALQGIRSALLHHNHAERIGLADAIDAYTINAAKLSHDELSKGRIDKGYIADLSIFDRSLETLSVPDAIQPKLVSVYKSGREVYAG